MTIFNGQTNNCVGINESNQKMDSEQKQERTKSDIYISAKTMRASHRQTHICPCYASAIICMNSLSPIHTHKAWMDGGNQHQ